MLDSKLSCQRCHQVLDRARLSCQYRTHGICPYSVHKKRPGLEVLSLPHGLLFILAVVCSYMVFQLWPTLAGFSPLIGYIQPFVYIIVLFLPIVLYISIGFRIQEKASGTFLLVSILLVFSQGSLAFLPTR